MKTEWMIIFNRYVPLFLIRLDISLPFYYYNDSMENVIRIRSIFSLELVMFHNYTFLKKRNATKFFGNGIKFLMNYTCRDFFVFFFF